MKTLRFESVAGRDGYFFLAAAFDAIRRAIRRGAEANVPRRDDFAVAARRGSMALWPSEPATI